MPPPATRHKGAKLFRAGYGPIPGADGHARGATKHGYRDTTGTLVIPFRFGGASDFSEGLAPVKVGRKWGYIDETGKYVVKPRFDMACSFYEGLTPVGVDGRWGFINRAASTSSTFSSTR